MMKITIVVFAVVIATALACHVDTDCSNVCVHHQEAFCNHAGTSGNGGQCDCRHHTGKRQACSNDADCAGHACAMDETPMCHSDHHNPHCYCG